tara:strand:+ start:898 stop:2067 length:1170 start_codon:yes stop_codon:yes gene_type:complete
MAKVNKITGRVVKKKLPRVGRRTGTSGVPLDKGFESVKSYFHMEVDNSEKSSIMKNYIKANRSKEDQKYIFANGEYNFHMFSHLTAVAFWINSAMPESEMIVSTGGTKGSLWRPALDKFIDDLKVKGIPLLKQKEEERAATSHIIVLSPMDKLQNKINATIMQDLDDLEDSWIEGNTSNIDVYTRMKFHGLGGSATKPVAKLIEGWLLDYGDAYHKRCEQAVEGYSHLKRPELKRRVEECEKMLADLEKLKSSSKAQRSIRVKKAPSLDKQISRLKYKKDDSTYKLTSISPALMIGARRIYTFNTKYKVITEYVTDTAKGFMISGSTLKGVDQLNSRQCSLRKPDEFIPIVLNKSIKQIGEAWEKLTTKTRVPNGRINEEVIILRVMDK